MSAAETVEVTLYERPQCHLCEEATQAIAPLVRQLGARLAQVDVEADAALEARYGLAVPVVLVDGVEATRAPIDVDAVRTASPTPSRRARGAAPIDRRRGRI